MVDHQYELSETNDGVNQVNLPLLSSAQEDFARDLIIEKEEDLIPALAAFETNDTVMFPRVAFKHSMTKLFPAKYWKYVGFVARKEEVKIFCRVKLVFASCQPCSAGVERHFSSGNIIYQISNYY